MIKGRIVCSQLSKSVTVSQVTEISRIYLMHGMCIYSDEIFIVSMEKGKCSV